MNATTNHYKARLEKIGDWMAQEGIALVMFEDTEGRRDASVRWFTGHPGDALLFLSRGPQSSSSKTSAASTMRDSPVACKSLLMPWDIILAKAYSRADLIIPYNDFDRMPL